MPSYWGPKEAWLAIQHARDLVRGKLATGLHSNLIVPDCICAERSKPHAGGITWDCRVLPLSGLPPTGKFIESSLFLLGQSPQGKSNSIISRRRTNAAH